MQILNNTAKLARSRIVIVSLVKNILYCLFFWSLFSFPVILLKQFLIINFNAAILPVILCIIIITAAVMVYMQRPGKREAICLADNNGGLKARLISGYDQMEKNWTSPYSELIREDISKHSENLEMKKLFPLQIPKFTITLPFMLLIIISLLIFQIPPHWFRNIDPDVFNQGIELEELSKKLLQENQDKKDNSNLALAEEMERLAEQFRSVPQSRAAAKEKLDDLVKRMKDNLKDSLRMSKNEMDSEIFQEAEDAFQMMDENQLTQDDINDLERRLMDSKELSPETKERISRQFDEYKTNPDERAQQDLAENLRNQMEGENPSPQGSESPLEETIRDLESGSESLADKNNNKPGEGNSDMETTGYDEESEDASSKSGSSSKPGTKDLPDEEDSFTREGLERQQQDSPDDLITSQDKVRAEVKNLPQVNRQKISSDNFDIEYRKAAEANIQKEDIPVSMREFIKDYFIGIGILNQETGSEAQGATDESE